MKRIVIAFAVLLNCTLMVAQTELDVLKYIQTDLNGTARYMGMGGAFGALGGDASSIKDNPAGLGIYRKSELVGTYDAMMQSTTSKWNNVSSITDAPYKTAFSNFSFVVANPTWKSENGSGSGLLSSNWSFGYNRLKNFNRSLNIKSGGATSSITQKMADLTTGLDSSLFSDNPFYNSDIRVLSVLAYNGFLINQVAGTTNWNSFLPNGAEVIPSYRLTESGHIDEYSFGWAGNFSNVFYLGTTLNLRKINYTSITTYSEEFGSGQWMDLNNTILTTGSGANLNIGAIVRPADFLRFGASLQTPTIYDMIDDYSSTLNYSVPNEKGIVVKPTYESPNKFQLQGPLQINLSGALILGKKGILSAEYDYSNYAGTRLMDENGDIQKYTYENDGMSAAMNNSGILKVGAEFRVTDNFVIRGGYANANANSKPTAHKLIPSDSERTDTEYFLHNNTNYFTAGFGYRESNWFVDVAFVNKIVDQSFYPYNSNGLVVAVQPASVITTNKNVLVSLGFKF